jgi:hypothetical protein
MNRLLAVPLAIALSSIALGGLVVRAQESGARTWHVPITPWGHPDLQGVWTTDAEIGIPVERPVQYGEKALLTDQEFQEKLKGPAGGSRRQATANESVSPDLEQWYGKTGNASRRTSLVVDPPNGGIPEYTAEAKQRVVPKGTVLGFVGGSFTDGPFDGPEDLNLFDRCITRGLPTTWYPSQYSNGFQIVQAREYVALLYERLHEARIIPLDGRPHPDPSASGRLLGDSRGRWEGTTLVVDVANFSDQTTFMKSGRTLHLIERYTRVDPDTLTVSVTVDDPTTWVRPWTFMVTGKRDADYWQIFEGACHEGNYAMQHILSAARAKEAEATAAKKKD